MNDREARVVLSIASEPGDERVGALVAEHGAVRALDLITQGEIKGGIRERVVKALASNQIAVAMQKLDACAGVFVTPSDLSWPRQLYDLDLATPLGLWCRGVGEVQELSEHSLAVVGARAATAYGERNASEVGSLAGEYGVTIVSGAAYGIDAAAHRGVLASGGRTIAVLACGVDVAYPSAHQGLLERVAENGLIISEAPPGSKPHKRRFLVRNRIIAALSASTLVVEAALRSGSLSTANWANALGRPVWGVPGPLSSATSAGVHVGISQGEMSIVADIASVLETVQPKSASSAYHSSSEELAILEVLKGGACTTDQLMRQLQPVTDSQLMTHDVLGILTLLELQGVIIQTALGWKCL
jgi:DNA processing protein